MPKVREKRFPSEVGDCCQKENWPKKECWANKKNSSPHRWVISSVLSLYVNILKLRVCSKINTITTSLAWWQMEHSCHYACTNLVCYSWWHISTMKILQSRVFISINKPLENHLKGKMNPESSQNRFHWHILVRSRKHYHSNLHFWCWPLEKKSRNQQCTIVFKNASSVMLLMAQKIIR